MSTNKDLIMAMLKKSMAEKTIKERRRRNSPAKLEVCNEEDERVAFLQDLKDSLKDSLEKIPAMESQGELFFRYNMDGNIEAFTPSQKKDGVRRISL